MNKEEITIPKQWFERLLKSVEQAQKDQDKWNTSTKEFMPASISHLIGYASSAKIILKCMKNK